MTDRFNQIKKIISEKVGIDPTEVTKDAYFEDDLNIGEMELVEILSEIEEVFHVDLMDDKDNISSVVDLLEILSEKLD